MGMGGKMPRRKQARRTNVKDMRSILRLTYGQELSVRAVSERLKLGKTTVSTYVLRAREAGLASCHCRRAMTMTRRLHRCPFCESRVRARKCVVWGKTVTVGGDFGVRRSFKKHIKM